MLTKDTRDKILTLINKEVVPRRRLYGAYGGGSLHGSSD